GAARDRAIVEEPLIDQRYIAGRADRERAVGAGGQGQWQRLLRDLWRRRNVNYYCSPRADRIAGKGTNYDIIDAGVIWGSVDDTIGGIGCGRNYVSALAPLIRERRSPDSRDSETNVAA